MDTAYDSGVAAPPTRQGFVVNGMPSDLAMRLRGSQFDDFGNPIVAFPSDDPVPCRHCLRLSAPGDRVILVAYRPFMTDGPYAEVGPVFIHADPCPAYRKHELFPTDFRERVLTMRGYNERGTIEAAEISQAGRPEASLERLFANERVRFVHVRNPAMGCYDFQVEREAAGVART